MPTEAVVELELWFREGVQWQAAVSQQRVRERAETLARASPRVEVSIRPIERYVPLADCERFSAFETWAESAGVSLSPAFDVRVRPDDDGRGVLVPPVVTMAVRRDGALAGVYPHADADGHRTVGEALDALDAELAGEPLP
ncbi:MAG: HTH domain-containing protein [Haloarculaceae archaeon]